MLAPPACVCGSQKRFERCCLQRVLNQHVDPVPLEPPGPTTQYANPSCYLAPSNNCDEKITQEHYISETVLNVLGDIVAVRGLPWIQPGQVRVLKLSALTAGVLCKRHNDALTHLDEAAGRFFGALRRMAFNDLASSKRVEVFSGHDIEKWFYKCLFGMLASRNLPEHSGGPVSASITTRCVELLMGSIGHQDGRGLHFRARYQHPVQATRQLRMKPILNTEKGTLQGLEANLLGFDVVASTCELIVENSVYRPSVLCFSRPESMRVIRLDWAQPGTDQVLLLTEHHH